ncbi:MAG: hypothetical protein HY342_00605 [Candidatus Lambdaproteobacteria bacterium]|nr:hypothetical protein [Candidatus Lambdaproteobacteria bacterium]
MQLPDGKTGEFVVGVAASLFAAMIIMIFRLFTMLTLPDTILLLVIGVPACFFFILLGMNQYRNWASGRHAKQAIEDASVGSRPEQRVVDQLARLRSDAIHDLLNRLVGSEEELRRFVADHEEWRQRVLALLRENFAEAIILTFDRLGSVPVRRFGHAYNPFHSHQLDMLSLRLEIIQRIVDRYSA